MSTANRKHHPRKADLREGQYWDEVGSAVVNAQTRKIILLGSDRVLYENERGGQRSIKISSFLRWAKAFAECEGVNA